MTELYINDRLTPLIVHDETELNPAYNTIDQVQRIVFSATNDAEIIISDLEAIVNQINQVGQYGFLDQLLIKSGKQELLLISPFVIITSYALGMSIEIESGEYQFIERNIHAKSKKASSKRKITHKK